MFIIIVSIIIFVLAVLAVYFLIKNNDNDNDNSTPSHIYSGNAGDWSDDQKNQYLSKIGKDADMVALCGTKFSNFQICEIDAVSQNYSYTTATTLGFKPDPKVVAPCLNLCAGQTGQWSDNFKQEITKLLKVIGYTSELCTVCIISASEKVYDPAEFLLMFMHINPKKPFDPKFQEIINNCINNKQCT